MNFQKLFQMQEELDLHIEQNHGLQNENLVSKKILALSVELGELANETRCFKFWSLKPPAAKEKILEEYVDGIHFILSLGLACGFGYQEIKQGEQISNGLTEQFLQVFDLISKFKTSNSFPDYESLFQSYISLGELLSFSPQEIELAYIQKNEVNYERQEKGY